jgi:DNA-binding NarL/FixJ family response regulator
MDTQQVMDILIVDDHQMFIDGIKVHLKKHQRINRIYEALNGKAALEVIKEQKPDLIITDIKMPEMTGLELIPIIKANYTKLKILVLTMYNDKEIIREIIDSEADGYILKNTSKQELINAINKIADGGTYYNNEVVSIMMEDYKKEKSPDIELSERELEVLKLICQELTTAEIAKALFISPFTVETHRKHMLQKTHSKTVVGLIKYAIKFNLI